MVTRCEVEVGIQGMHFIDAIRWLTGDLAPRWIAALGGRLCYAAWREARVDRW